MDLILRIVGVPLLFLVFMFQGFALADTVSPVNTAIGRAQGFQTPNFLTLNKAADPNPSQGFSLDNCIHNKEETYDAGCTVELADSKILEVSFLSDNSCRAELSTSNPPKVLSTNITPQNIFYGHSSNSNFCQALLQSQIANQHVHASIRLMKYYLAPDGPEGELRLVRIRTEESP